MKTKTLWFVQTKKFEQEVKSREEAFSLASRQRLTEFDLVEIKINTTKMATPPPTYKPVEEEEEEVGC